MRRLTNILDKHSSINSVWEVAEKVRIDWLTNNSYHFEDCEDSMISDHTQSQLLEQIILRLGLTDVQDLNLTEASVKDESLEAASEIHYYLCVCPRTYWTDQVQFLTSLVTDSPTRLLLATTNSIILKAQQMGRDIEAEAFRSFLDKLTDILALDHKNIMNFIHDGTRSENLGNYIVDSCMYEQSNIFVCVG